MMDALFGMTRDSSSSTTSLISVSEENMESVSSLSSSVAAVGHRLLSKKESSEEVSSEELDIFRGVIGVYRITHKDN